MQTLESLAPLPGHTPPPKSDWPDSDSSRTPNDQFDLIMGRTLSHSQSESDPEPSDPQPVRTKARPDKASSSDTNTPAAADAAGALYAAALPPPQPDAVTIREDSGVDSACAAAALEAPARALSSRSTKSEQSALSPAVQHGDPPDSSTEPKDATPTDAAKAAGTNEPSRTSPPDGQSPEANAPDGDPASQLVKSLTPTIPEKATEANFASGSVDPPAKISLGGLARANATDPENLGGISSAQQHLAMQKADKTKESAAPAQQNLPASPANGAGDELPARMAARTASLVARSSQSETPAASVIPVSSSSTAPQAAGATSAPSAQWPSTDPMRSLERTHDLMSLHAFRLRDSGSDSLQVMIKPGAGLQISLQLQMRDGAVEMKATLHRGDFDLLSRNWQQLQQQLEPRGVRLAPLLSGNPTTTGNNPFFQPPGNRPEDQDSEPAGTLTGLALAGALKPTVAKSRTARGWETWA